MCVSVYVIKVRIARRQEGGVRRTGKQREVRHHIRHRGRGNSDQVSMGPGKMGDAEEKGVRD